MLVNFSVSNFLSFNEEQTFSMAAGRVRGNSDRIFREQSLRIKKCSAILGLNASGKSNFIRALNFTRHTIVHGLPRGFSNMYFRLGEDNASRSSYFTTQILIEKRLIEYGFSLTLRTGVIDSEWLVEITPSTGTQRIIYKREPLIGRYEFGGQFKGKKIRDKLSLYAEDSAKESSILFLTMMNQGKDQLYENEPEATVLRDVYNWFKDDLIIRFPSNAMTHYFFLSDVDIDEIAELLHSFGTGITSAKIKNMTVEEAKAKIPEGVFNDVIQNIEKDLAANTASEKFDGEILSLYSFKRFYTFKARSINDLHIETIEFAHEKDNIYFELNEESDGTARLLELLEILLSKDDSAVYIVDELDRCLNPMITRAFAEKYMELAKKRNIQLIFSTNESTLLDTAIFRNDELELIGKDEYGQSCLHSMEDLRLRSDRNLFQAYFYGEEFGKFRPNRK